MNKERRQKLFNDYPDLFMKVDESNSQRYPILSWGLEHGDGWLSLIEDLCYLIQAHVNCKLAKDSNTLQPKIQQVKEKFGGLRFYMHNCDDYMCGLITMAEKISTSTCEECGMPGTIRGKGWIRVRCDACEITRERKFNEDENARKLDQSTGD